jgi:MFS family permease
MTALAWPRKARAAHDRRPITGGTGATAAAGRLRAGGSGLGFARLWAAVGVSNLGDGVASAALPLLAAALTQDPMLVAGLAVAQQVPWLLFALPAGVIVDRSDRRRLMWRTDALRALAVAALAVLVAVGQGSLALLYAIAFALGVAETLFDTAYRSLVPSLVGKGDLERANARLYGAEIVANRFAGPPLGGLLFTAAASAPLFLDAGSFLLAAVAVFAIAGRFRPAGADVAATPMRAAVGEGIRWLAGHRLLRSLAVVVSVWHLVWGAGSAILVLYAQELLELGSAGFGVLLAAGAVGSVLGTVLTSRLAGSVGRRRVLVGAVAVAAAAQLGLALTSNPVVAGVALAVSGMSAVVWNVITVALRQRLTPDALLGRVNSAYRFAAIGAVALGAALGGALGTIDLRLPFVVAAATLLLTAAGLLAFTRDSKSSAELS